MALNKVMLIGNVGNKPEVRYLDKDTKVARFSLATTERYTDRSGERKEVTEWHRIVAWRGQAELSEKYLEKGRQVYVEGKLKSSQYQKDGQTRESVEIVAERIMLLDRKGAGEGTRTEEAQRAQGSRAESPRAKSPEPMTPPDDDFPF